jgi:ribosomal protein S12 methylthiotransferase
MNVALITLGCPKNLVDAEVMLGIIDRAGHTLVDDPANADAIVVNTCAFISAAVDESRRVIEGCLALKRGGSARWVILAGCLPQRYGDETAGLFPDVDGVVGCSHFLEIADALADVAAGRRVSRVSTPKAVYDHLSPRVLATPRHLAYVKIAEGCDNRCSYCTVPLLRGALRSRDPESITAEVESLLELGVREVNLIAQDTTAYGTDIASPVRLPQILERVARLGVPWIRIMYAHPARLTDELLSAMASISSVVPYLDMPIQHVSDRILRAMGRGIGGEGVRSAIERLRGAVPGVAVRSSVMVGFPGESENDFEELLTFVRQGRVDSLGVFEFSPEPGTPAFSLGDQVPAETASARARAIVAAMSDVAAARGASTVGREVVVLVDEGGMEASGRTAGQAWEIDGRVLLAEGDATPVGSFVGVRITGASGHDLLGSVVREGARSSGRAPVRRRRDRTSPRRPGGETA